MLGANKVELEAVLAEFPSRYEDNYLGLMRHKLGLQRCKKKAMPN